MWQQFSRFTSIRLNSWLSTHVTVCKAVKVYLDFIAIYINGVEKWIKLQGLLCSIATGIKDLIIYSSIRTRMMMLLLLLLLIIIIQFFIIYMPSQQLQGQLQAQHSVDTR
jgi:hypothetical protein